MMVRFSLRLPDDLHTRITTAAEKDRRSIHAEILWLIEHGLDAVGETESTSFPP